MQNSHNTCKGTLCSPACTMHLLFARALALRHFSRQLRYGPVAFQTSCPCHAACCCPCSHHVCTGSCAMNPWLFKPPTHAMLLATSLLHLSCMPCCLLLPLPSPYLHRQLRRGLLCFVRLRRYEHMTLQQCLHGIRTRDIPWMRREKGEALSLLCPWGTLADCSEQRCSWPHPLHPCLPDGLQ